MIFNPTIDSLPTSDNVSVFSCDERYFLNYGIYNITSCNKIGQQVHVNIINPSDNTFAKIKNLQDQNINFSYSYENVSIENYYAFKSYLFCNRYFISQYIFENSSVDTLYITDADIIYKEKFGFSLDKKIGIIFKPDEKTLWKQSGGNFMFIRRSKKVFLKYFLNEFIKRFTDTIWGDYSKLSKIERANIVGLDQVCLSYVLLNHKIVDGDFLNLAQTDILSKDYNSTSKIWTLTGNAKNTQNLSDKLEKILE